MELVQLYKIAETKNILIKSVSLEHKSAFCIAENGLEGIGIDYAKVNTEKKEKSVLAEELAHLQYGLTYKLEDMHSPIGRQNIKRKEYQAKRHAAVLLVPFKDLQTAINSGCREVWELAEYFNVSEDAIIEAVEYYKTQLKIF